MPKLIIDDSNWQQHAQVIPAGMSKGRMARDWTRQPFGSVAPKFTDHFEKIPRSKWSDLIKQKAATKSRMRDFYEYLKIGPLDQNGTNYCWCNAVVSAMRLMRAKEGQQFVELSPASVAAPIKGYSNVGGWGGEALAYIREHGICEASLWPANAISRKYDTAESQANRLLHKVTEWYELASGDFDALATCLLLGFPVAIGLNWWSHEVCALDLVEISAGRFGVDILNSWGRSYGENGIATLSESKGTPDDACAIRATTASFATAA